MVDDICSLFRAVKRAVKRRILIARLWVLRLLAGNNAVVRGCVFRTKTKLEAKDGMGWIVMDNSVVEGGKVSLTSGNDTDKVSDDYGR